MVRITKNFTLEELYASDTARAKGINNRPTTEAIGNLTRLAYCLLQPLRDKLGKPIIITSGYRSQALNKAIGGTPTSQHCLDTKTEILTPDGWKRNTEISIGDKVLNYNPTTGLIEEDVVLNKIEYFYKGDMVLFSNKVGNCYVTENHRMYNTPYSRVDNFQFREAKTLYRKRSVHYTSGILNRTKSTHNINMLRLGIAVICDGCVYKRANANTPIIQFNLKKQRKIEELENILNQLKIKYSKRYCKNRESKGQYGVYEYRINQTYSKPIIDIIGVNKKIPRWFLQELNSDEICQLLDTYINFDGCVDKRKNCTGKSISSVDKDNIDILQAMAVLCNYRCILKEYTNRKTNFGNSNIYILSLSEHNRIRFNESDVCIIPDKLEVWCITTSNSTIITRREGRTLIMGNCKGEAADLYSPGMTIKELYNFVKSSGLEYDQMIEEGTWLHLSYRKGHNRKENLLYRNKRYIKDN